MESIVPGIITAKLLDPVLSPKYICCLAVMVEDVEEKKETVVPMVELEEGVYQGEKFSYDPATETF